MKKVVKGILALTIVLLLCFMASGCNKQLFDTTYNFNKAILSLPDGTVISGNVDSWTDFADGDQIQVKINGVTYLIHSSDIVLISD